MSRFVDIGVSVFDDDFTLDPYAHLKDLYDRPEVLGFHSDEMNFLFRFDQVRAVLFNRDCARASGDNDQLRELEADYAVRFPNRAWHFFNSYTHGEPDLKFKAAIGRFVAEVAEQASFAEAEPIFSMLAAGGMLDNYIEIISRLPMRIFLQTCLLPHDDQVVEELHVAGSAFLKSLENFYDEALIADCDRGLAVIRHYVEQHFHSLDPASPLVGLIQAGRDAGMSDEQLIANIGGMFLTSISNTVGISSAFILRSLLRDHGAWEDLRARPELCHDEQMILELLRRDNHVKALSRQFNQPMELDGFTMKAGEVVCLYFPGVNMDPNHWPEPQAIDFSRRFTGENNIIFGGSFYTCIGRKLTMTFLGNMIEGFIRYLPTSAAVKESEVRVDGNWMAERILTRLPIHLS